MPSLQQQQQQQAGFQEQQPQQAPLPWPGMDSADVARYDARARVLLAGGPPPLPSTRFERLFQGKGVPLERCMLPHPDAERLMGLLGKVSKCCDWRAGLRPTLCAGSVWYVM